MEQFCAVCSKSIPGDVLNKNIKDIIDDLNITLVDTPTSGDRFICQPCLAKVHSVFDFKCICIYSEDLLDPYIKEDNYKINLKDVYKREVKMLDENNSDEVCRLCMNLYRKEFVVPLSTILEQPSYSELFRKYIPQVSLEAVANPVLCKKCVFRLREFEIFFPPTKNLKEHLEPSKAKQRSAEVNESKLFTVGITTEQEEIDICNSILKEFQFSMSLTGKVSMSTSNIYDSDDKILEISDNSAVMRIFECQLCKYQTVEFRPLWKHSERHMPTKIFKCIFCSYITRYESKFINHDKKHTTSCPYQIPCPTCKGIKVQSLKGHACFRCKKMSVKAKKDILQDLSVKHNLNCDQCSAKLYHRKCLFHHKNNHLICAQFICEWCSLELDSDKALNQHISVKLLKCNRCPLVLKCKTHYREHQKQHFAKKRCKYCEQEVRHVLQHTMNAQDRGLHRCSMCAYKAPCINILRRHKEVVHDRLRCCHCKFSSSAIHHFEKHMEDHRNNGEKFYRCKICPVVIKKQHNIKTHMLSVHNIS